MKNNEAIRNQTNLSYQLNDIQSKLEGVISDPERFKLRVKKQKALIALREAQNEVYNLYNNVM